MCMLHSINSSWSNFLLSLDHQLYYVPYAQLSLWLTKKLVVREMWKNITRKNAFWLLIRILYSSRQNKRNIYSNLFPSFAHQTQVKLLRTWTIDDVCEWLKGISLEQYCDSFRYNAIDGMELMQLNDNVLLTSLQIGL